MLKEKDIISERNRTFAGPGGQALNESWFAEGKRTR